MLTVAVAVYLSLRYGLRPERWRLITPGSCLILLIAITLTAGTVFLMWIGEQITARGVGNGISLIIFAGIRIQTPDGLKVIFQYLASWHGQHFECYFVRGYSLGAW